MKHVFGLTILILIVTFSGVTRAQQAKTMKTGKTENQSLSGKQKSIVTIAALTAKGDLEKLQMALSVGLEAGLTVNEIKEVPRANVCLRAFRFICSINRGAGARRAARSP
jgi:4-carboxymuconolactone decarboxylase